LEEGKVPHMKALLGIGAALVIAMTGGCGRSGESKQVLRIASWGSAGDDSLAAQIERETLAEFERQNPGIEIQVENTPGSGEYARKMMLAYVAGAEPDVLRLDASSAAVFINNNVLQDLTPFIQTDPEFKLDDFYPNVVDIARKDGKLYAIPVDFTPMVMYLNVKLFKEAGVPLPKAGWTWTDFRQKAKELTSKDSYGFVFSNWMPGWIMWFWNNGADVFGPDMEAQGAANSSEAVEAVTFLRDLIEKDRSSPSLSQMAAEGASLFPNGKAAMEISGHWNLVSLANAPGIKLTDVMVVPLPVAKKGTPSVTALYESGWSIPRRAKNRDLAWKFIKYYTSRAVQEKVQQSGIGICARKDVAEARANNEREKAFVAIVPSGRRPWGSLVEEYGFVESEGQRMMDSVLKTGKTPREALDRFAQAVDRQLRRQ
jgi:multiple sugar transport system substrate-binding protein